ncbi:hypothetical protein HDV00_002597 [Rhizophlyctis rosea]|nr:hypothetical protein HDV00_002597 [Rhizophlyctis rosea]
MNALARVRAAQQASAKALEQVKVVPSVFDTHSEAHRKYVCRLYKRSLRTCKDWYWQLVEKREKQMIVRKIFEDGRQVTNPREIHGLLTYAEYALDIYANPTPYRSPSAPGGTSWERNVEMPEELRKRGMTPINLNGRYLGQPTTENIGFGRTFK